MIIEHNKVVAVNYALHIPGESGGPEELVEQTNSEQPFVFLFGAGGLIEAFEENLKGKAVGDSFDFRIAAADGYGEYDQEKIAELPIDAFKGPEGEIDTEMVVVGNELPMVDQEGNRLLGIVAEVTESYVAMDFNHPLAGNDLHFTGTILEVRPATAEEISHGHVHGPGGHQH